VSRSIAVRQPNATPLTSNSAEPVRAHLNFVSKECVDNCTI
jgi:hypothetical protein